jgi:hypothetical protein
MVKVTLYKEGITKTPGLFIGGFKLPFQSMRASWARVALDIDDGVQHLQLSAMKIQKVSLPAGSHKFTATHPRFASGQVTAEIGKHSQDIVVVSPLHRTAVSRDASLGTLRVDVVASPENLQPYAFYKGLPTSLGHSSVASSVAVSIVNHCSGHPCGTLRTRRSGCSARWCTSHACCSAGGRRRGAGTCRDVWNRGALRFSCVSIGPEPIIGDSAEKHRQLALRQVKGRCGCDPSSQRPA